MTVMRPVTLTLRAPQVQPLVAAAIGLIDWDSAIADLLSEGSR